MQKDAIVHKKILLVSTSTLMVSGATFSLLGLAEALIALGYDVTIGLPGKGSLKDECDKRHLKNVVFKHFVYDCWYTNRSRQSNSIKKRTRVFLKKSYNILAYWRIVHYLSTEKFDIVHINASTDGLFAKASYKVGTKVVWHFREFMEEDLNNEFCNRPKAISAFNHAAKIIAISYAVKNKYLDEISSDISVVYNGIDVDRFYKSRQIFADKTIKISIVGRITPEKGQEQLINAILELVEKGYKSFKVRIIGTTRSDTYIAKLKKTITDNNLETMFDFIDFSNEIEQLYWNTDIVCVCSNKEAFGRVTVEAMASGALVIGSNSGGTLELIEDGKTGYLYDVNSTTSLACAIEKSIIDTKLSNVIAQNGQVWAFNNFTVQNNAIHIAEIYDDVVSETES